MKRLGIACIWGLSVVAAFFAGGVLSGPPRQPEVVETAEMTELRERVLELTAAIDRNRTAGRERVDRNSITANEASGKADDATAADAAEGATEKEGAAPPTFSLAAATSGAEASRDLMAFAEAQLDRGDEGHAAILSAIGDVWTDREKMQELFGDETQAVRQLYPWIRFLVHHETEVLGLTDYVFRTMAEEPSAFEDIPDDDVLELFTEGVAILLPGAVDEETMDVFRGYAVEILATPASEQPRAIQGNRDRIERLLATFWAQPVTPEEALDLLRSGDVPTAQVPRLLRLVPPERSAELDVEALILPLLREGNHEVIRILRTHRNADIDSWRTDQAVLEGLGSGRVHRWFVQQYFDAIGHERWSDVRAFFDRAFDGSESARNAAVQALLHGLNPRLRPDKVYVEDLLARHELDERIAANLRRAYGLDE